MEDIVKQRQPVKQMPILSDDVLIEILLKLPLRTLLSFKSVSKHWLSLIKNPNFVDLLTKRPTDDVRINPMLILRNVRNSKKAATKRTKTVLTTLLSYDDDETLRYEDDDVLNLDHVFPKRYGVDVRLLGPCNGLFCIIDTFDVVVLNPTTRRCRKLPQSRLVSHYRSSVGFGFDPVCNDHKVFWFKEVAYKDYDDDLYDDDYDDDYEIRGYKVDVFSLSTKRWRKIEDVVPACNTFRLDSHSLFVNGAFHWLERYCSSIIVFDITEESFELFDLPITFRVGGDELTLSVLNESLALICQKLDTDAFEICVMEEYGRDTSWMKLYSFSCVVAIEKPLSFGQEEEFLLQKKNGKLVSFNLNKRVIKDFQVRGVSGEMYAFRYKESLVSLK